MAKTYILEPNVLTYKALEGTISNFFRAPVAILPEYESDDDFKNSVLEIDGVVKLKYAVLTENGTALFTEDGKMPESAPEIFAELDPSGESSAIRVKSSAMNNGDYTTSIYTGEDDPEPSGGLPGLKDKNVVYEYQMLANNNIKDICLALKEYRAKLDPDTVYPENPGYSVTQDMVSVLSNIVTLKGYALPPKAYANDMETIAALIRCLAGEPKGDDQI